VQGGPFLKDRSSILSVWQETADADALKAANLLDGAWAEL